MSKKFKLSGSTKRLIDKAISRGWRPGMSAPSIARGNRAITRKSETIKAIGGQNEC